MSHRNVVNCLWGKPFRQFCSSHGDPPVSRSVLGACFRPSLFAKVGEQYLLTGAYPTAIAWPIDPAPITTMTLLMLLSSIDLICRRAPPSERDSGLLGLGSD
jgi:hypothetical protein